MNFGFDEDQVHIADSVRQVVLERYPMSYVRRMLNDPRGFSPQWWTDAAELGWLGLLVEERFGGANLGAMDLVAAQQELGRGLVPGPFLSSAVMATTALARAGSEAQKTHWLSRLVRGEVIGTIALQEPNGAWDAGGVTLPARKDGDFFTLTGEKRFVTDAHVADFIVVPARINSGNGTVDITLFLIETSAPGVSIRLMQTIDPTRRLCEVHFDRVRAGPDAILGIVGEGWPIIEHVADIARVALCAEMVGGAERALEMSTEYARTRQQFGRPIGSFQAIQHKCADMLVRLEGSRAMTMAAALSLDNGEADASTDTSIAKSHCNETYRAISTEGIQIHGGLGFTWELDMHLFYKRAKASETLLGDSRFHRMRLAARIEESAR